LRSIKTITLIMTVLLLTLYGWELYTYGSQDFLSITNTTFGGCLILLCLLYYYNLFTNEDDLLLTKIPAFWFVTGCFIFYATATGFNAFYNEINYFSEVYKLSIRFLGLNLINVIMYGCWIKAFLCLRKNQRYYQGLS
jgi:hypothetical protein